MIRHIGEGKLPINGMLQQPVTPEIAVGINRAVNLMPIVCIALSLISLAFYNISEEKAKEIHARLEVRHTAQAAEPAEG